MINQNEEIWKDIPEYEGFYQVSNLGRIKSLARITTNNKPVKETILKPQEDGSGYKQVYLCKNRKVRPYKVHRLVASAFISNPDNLPCINHKDENRTNNCLDNLEWCTYEYNTNYGNRNINASKQLKGINAKAVRCIKTGKIFNSATEASRYLGFSDNRIATAIYNKQKAGGFYWEYVND